MHHSKPADTHMETGVNLTGEMKVLLHISYRQAIGCLTYLSASSHPYISFAVSRHAKYVKKSEETRWKAVKRVFR